MNVSLTHLLRILDSLQGARFLVPILWRFLRVFMINHIFSNKESVCDHEKATPSLRISDFFASIPTFEFDYF